MPTNMTIHRRKAWFSAILPFSVYIDDEKIGLVANGKTETFELTPGSHTLAIRVENERSDRIVAKPSALMEFTVPDNAVVQLEAFIDKKRINVELAESHQNDPAVTLTTSTQAGASSATNESSLTGRAVVFYALSALFMLAFVGCAAVLGFALVTQLTGKASSSSGGHWLRLVGAMVVWFALAALFRFLAMRSHSTTTEDADLDSEESVP